MLPWVETQVIHVSISKSTTQWVTHRHNQSNRYYRILNLRLKNISCLILWLLQDWIWLQKSKLELTCIFCWHSSTSCISPSLARQNTSLVTGSWSLSCPRHLTSSPELASFTLLASRVPWSEVITLSQASSALPRFRVHRDNNVMHMHDNIDDIK